LDRGTADWLPFSRIALEWLHPKRDLEPDSWVPEVVERAQALNIDTLAFDLYHGGYAVFEGAVAPKDGHEGDADVLALLEREVHARGMRLVLMHMAGHCASYASVEHPTWRVREADGSPRLGIHADQMCLNTPYANFLIQEFRGVLSRYRLDGLYIEGLYGQLCYCDYCQAEYLATHGQPVPVYPDPEWRGHGAIGPDRRGRPLAPEHLRFISNIPTEFVRRVRQTIDEVSPDTAFLPCPSWFEGSYVDFHSWGRYSDAITLERQWGFERFKIPLMIMGLSIQAIRAESGRTPFGTLWLGWNVDRDYSPCTPQHYRLNFAEILLYGGTPQLHAQTIFEVDQSEMDTVKEMYDFEEAVAPYLRDARQEALVGLVIDWTEAELSGHLLGFYQALIERHIPFRLMAKRDLATITTADVGVLGLPNVERLSDAEVEGVQRFFADGGGVVLTYRTGARDEDGRSRATWPFQEMAGASGPYGIVSTPPTDDPKRELVGEKFELLPMTYYRVRTDSPIAGYERGRLQSFRGRYVRVAPTTGRVFVDAVDYDYSKMHHHHPVLGWYPGDVIAPLVIGNEAVGRCVSFAAEFDASATTSGMPGLLESLADAVEWVAADRTSAVRIMTSPTVEAATHFSASAGTCTVLLVNGTTNQLAPNWVVRHVEPVRDVRIRLDAPTRTGASVRSVRGAPVTWTHDGSAYDIRLERLDEYDAVVIDVGT
jgi:hypothetical protein